VVERRGAVKEIRADSVLAEKWIRWKELTREGMPAGKSIS